MPSKSHKLSTSLYGTLDELETCLRDCVASLATLPRRRGGSVGIGE